MLGKVNIKEIDVEKANNSLGSNAFIVDVRTPEEYNQGHIKGSTNVPLDEIFTKIQSTIKDKNAEVFVYCRSGVRSHEAVVQMSKMGYKNAVNIRGGILSWLANGYRISSS